MFASQHRFTSSPTESVAQMDFSSFGPEVSQFVESVKTAFNSRLADSAKSPEAHSPTDADIRAAILTVLAGGSKNTDEIATQISRASGGSWHPAPGTLHIALDGLTTEGLVSFELVDSKNSFTATDAGRAWLESYDADAAGHSDSHGEGTRNFGAAKTREISDLIKAKAELAKAAAQLGQALAAAGTNGSATLIQDVAKLTQETATQIFAKLGKAN